MKRLLLVVTMLGALGFSASAQAATTLNASLSATSVTEGQPLGITVTSSNGTPFPAGTTVSVASRDGSFWTGQSYGTFALPTGATTATFQFVIDNTMVNALPTTAVSLALATNDPATVTATPSFFSIDVIDNDAPGVAAPAPVPTTTPAPTTPSATPTIPADPSSSSAATTALGTLPVFKKRIDLEGKRIKLKITIPSRILSGIVAITRGGKVSAKKVVEASPSTLVTIAKVTLRSKDARSLRARGGRITAYFFYRDTDDKIYYVSQKYAF